MAIVAGVAARDMCRVLAGCGHAVVAGTTVADYLAMIDRHDRYENIRAMAVFTDIRRLNMPRVLAGRVGAVVAADAVSGDIDVVEICRQPGDRAVTVIAVVAARNVRRIFASGDDAIVACAATADYLGMVDSHCGRECIGGMAVFADIRGIDMSLVLADRVRAVMAGTACAQDLGVVHNRNRRKRIRVVTVFTDVCRLNMRRVFAGCFRPVVTADAIAHNIHMIELGR